jgi:hypothetical protein
MAMSLDSKPVRLHAPKPAPSGGLPAALTSTSWRPRVELTATQWFRQGRWLGALARGSGWWIGDWLRYGSARYGERYAPAAQATGYDVHSLMNMAYVAGRFDISRRRDALSFSHHAALAGLPVEEQDLWLDRTEVSRLSVRQLRSELRQARRRAEPRVERRQDEPPLINASGPIVGRATRAGPSRKLPRSFDATTDLVCPECGHHFGAGPLSAKAEGDPADPVDPNCGSPHSAAHAADVSFGQR